MKKGDLIITINGIDFWYGGYNVHGWHLIFTHNENFHVYDYPTEKDCKLIYKNYYE